MSVTRPCIVGKMGSTVFYETTMTARELSGTVRAAQETDEWSDQGIEERIQRDVNLNRIRQTIVPYLAKHPDRFFGSFIVLAPQGSLEFEPLADLVKDLPVSYRNAGSSMGYLTIGSGELIALDGQHRLLAFRDVITGGGSQGNDFKAEVGDDEVCVLFIEFEDLVKTRRIFNKVNRNAKPTGKSDNIITSQDDGFAIVSRWLLDPRRHAPLAARKISNGAVYEPVNWKGTTLNAKAEHLTTLSTVYETVKQYLLLQGVEGFSEDENPVAPSDEALEAGLEHAIEIWEALLSLEVMRESLDDPSKVPDVRFAHDDNRTLLLRPVGQQILVAGLVLAIERSGHELTLAELMPRVEQIDWSADPKSMWRDVIVKPDGKMINRKEKQLLGARLVAHLLAPEHESTEDAEHLRVDWNSARGRDPFTPLDRLSDDEVPEDLPKPVSS